MAAVTIQSDSEAQENKICHCFHFSPSICQEVMGLDTMILVLWVLSFKPAFSLSSSTFIKKLFSSSLLSVLVWYHLHIWDCWYFSQQSWFQLVIYPVQQVFSCSDSHKVFCHPLWNVPSLWVLTLHIMICRVTSSTGRVVLLLFCVTSGKSIHFSGFQFLTFKVHTTEPNIHITG